MCFVKEGILQNETLPWEWHCICRNSLRPCQELAFHELRYQHSKVVFLKSILWFWHLLDYLQQVISNSHLNLKRKCDWSSSCCRTRVRNEEEKNVSNEPGISVWGRFFVQVFKTRSKVALLMGLMRQWSLIKQNIKNKHYGIMIMIVIVILFVCARTFQQRDNDFSCRDCLQLLKQ